MVSGALFPFFIMRAYLTQEKLNFINLGYKNRQLNIVTIEQLPVNYMNNNKTGNDRFYGKKQKGKEKEKKGIRGDLFNFFF